MTPTSRRTLLRAGSLGALLAPLVPGWLTPADASTNLYARARFARLVKARFVLAGGTGTWWLTLVRVSDLPGAPRGDGNRFNLTFRTSIAGPPQGTYRLKRRGFTTTTVFLVPSDASRHTYQAIINRA